MTLITNEYCIVMKEFLFNKWTHKNVLVSSFSSLLQQICSVEVRQRHNQEAITSLPGSRALHSLSASASDSPRVLV